MVQKRGEKRNKRERRETERATQPFVFILATFEIRIALSKKQNLNGPVFKTPGRHTIQHFLPTNRFHISDENDRVSLVCNQD